MRPFRDRRQAGRMLAGELERALPHRDVVVLGLPRGGVPVAAEVAEVLGAQLDAFAVRKIGAPEAEEYALGALASGGIEFIDWPRVHLLGIDPSRVATIVERERAELARRERAYRDSRPAPDLTGKVVVLVDDGLATGSTMRAAVQAVRGRQPARIVVAVPVASEEAVDTLRSEGIECHVVATPFPFIAVGAWYRDFAQVTDEEVRELLGRAAVRVAAAPSPE